MGRSISALSACKAKTGSSTGREFDSRSDMRLDLTRLAALDVYGRVEWLPGPCAVKVGSGLIGVTCLAI